MDERIWGSFLEWLEEQYGDSFFTDNDDEAAYVNGQCVASYNYDNGAVTIYNFNIWKGFDR